MEIKATLGNTPIPLLSAVITESIGAATMSGEVAAHVGFPLGSRLHASTWDGSSWTERGEWVVVEYTTANATANRFRALPVGAVVADAALVSPYEDSKTVAGNVGAWLIDLMNAARARGAMSGTSQAFTATSAAWPSVPMELSGAQSIGSVLSQLASSGVVIPRWVGSVLELRLPGQGSGIRPSTGFLRETRELITDANRVVARTPDGVEREIVENAAALSAMGRLEKPVVVGGSTGPASTQLFAEAELAAAAGTLSRSFFMNDGPIPAPGTNHFMVGLEAAEPVLGWTITNSVNEQSVVLELGSDREITAEKLMRRAKSYDSGLGTARIQASKTTIPSDNLNIRGWVFPERGGIPALGGKIRVAIVQNDATVLTEPLEVLEGFRPVGGEPVQVVDGVVRGVVYNPERPGEPFRFTRTWLAPEDSVAIPDMPDGVRVIDNRWTRVSMHRFIPMSDIPAGTGMLELDPSVAPVLASNTWGVRTNMNGQSEWQFMPGMAGSTRHWGRLETIDADLDLTFTEPVLLELIWDGRTEAGEPAVGFVNALPFPSISSPNTTRSIHVDLLVPTGPAERTMSNGKPNNTTYWDIGSEAGGFCWGRGGADASGAVVDSEVRATVPAAFQTLPAGSPDYLLRLDIPGAGTPIMTGTPAPQPVDYSERTISARHSTSESTFVTRQSGGIPGRGNIGGGLSFWRGLDWTGWDYEEDISGLLGYPGTLRLFAVPGTSIVLGQLDSTITSAPEAAGIPVAVPIPDGWETTVRTESSSRKPGGRGYHTVVRDTGVVAWLWDGPLQPEPLYFLYERPSAP